LAPCIHKLRQSTSALMGDLDPYPWVFKFKMLYLDPCRFQPPGDSEPRVKNSWVLEYLWAHRYLEVLTSTQDIKYNKVVNFKCKYMWNK